MPDWKTEFKNRINSNQIQTDSQISDFCAKFHVSEKDAFQHLYQLRTADTPCEGCAHIAFFNSGMYPCCNCSRSKPDLYEHPPVKE